MVSKFETVFLGVVERKSKQGNSYNVVTFLDEGSAVSVMLAKDVDTRSLPDVLSPCIVTVSASLGRYQRIEVLDIERAK